ncbi:hypothetical protein JQK88_17380 [Mesorhizobium caraganae]|uniref:hypothetical protein n=1 Tax=Mesorhizobium caraganae TaxID=483206 RepID=UPI0017822E2C|nr:hypothetical protein [Mesorhizobium caraganae]MBM2712951.1 hypothetical protein [Mesorhizobium caraganae]
MKRETTVESEKELSMVSLPHAWPRPGATLILENSRGAAWDVKFTQGVYSNFHKHLYHYAGVDLAYAAYEVIHPDGSSETKVTFPGRMWILPKGLTHMEKGVSSVGRHIVVVDIKDTAPAGDGKSVFELNDIAESDYKLVTQDYFYKQYDVTIGPDSHINRSYWPNDTFIVFVTPGQIIMEESDEKVLNFDVGNVLFLDRGRKISLRSADGAVRLMLLELL